MEGNMEIKERRKGEGGGRDCRGCTAVGSLVLLFSFQGQRIDAIKRARCCRRKKTKEKKGKKKILTESLAYLSWKTWQTY